MVKHKVPKYKSLYSDMKSAFESMEYNCKSHLSEIEKLKTINNSLKIELEKQKQYPIMPATYIIGLMKINNNKVVDVYHEITESEYKILTEIYMKKNKN